MSAMWRAARFTAPMLVVVWVAATLTGPTQALAEPLETTSPVCQPNTVEVTYTTFGAQNIPIKLQVWLPVSGSNLPAVVMVHLGSWKNGSKCSASINNVAPAFIANGFVVIAIDYRLTSDPGCADPTIDYPNLCLGPGDGTIGAINEPVDDLQTAILWVRQNHSTCGLDPRLYSCSIDPTKVGVLGMSSGGNLAGVSGVTGAEGQARADAVVTWSGALHLEDDNQPARANYIGCAYVDCQNAWDNASPYHLCCNVGNVSASTPFLLFNSQDELIPVLEPNEMYDLVSPTTIKITKVLLRGTAHAAEYRLATILCAGGDRCASNEGWTPTGTVTDASVAWLQAHLCGLPVC